MILIPRNYFQVRCIQRGTSTFLEYGAAHESQRQRYNFCHRSAIIHLNGGRQEYSTESLSLLVRRKKILSEPRWKLATLSTTFFVPFSLLCGMNTWLFCFKCKKQREGKRSDYSRLVVRDSIIIESHRRDICPCRVWQATWQLDDSIKHPNFWSYNSRGDNAGNQYLRKTAIHCSRRWTRLLLILMKTEDGRRWRLTRVHNAARALVPRNCASVMQPPLLVCDLGTAWARSAFVHHLGGIDSSTIGFA